MSFKFSNKVLPLLLLVSVGQLSAQETQNDNVRVQTQSLTDLVIYPSNKVAASVESLNHAQVSSETNGRIEALFALVGDVVKQGQKLAQLDCRLANLERSAANTSFALAKKEADRAKALNNSNNIAKQQYNQAQSSYQQASIRVQQAKLAVTNCVVVAPYDGVVTNKIGQLGGYATIGSPLFTVLDTQNIELVAALGESARHSIVNAKRLIFVTEGKSHAVTIRAWLPFVDPNTNQQAILLRFIDAKPLVGSAGQLVWEEQSPHLPSNLLVQRSGSLGYFVAVDATAQFIEVANATLGQPVEIPLQGAQAITQVITQGRYSVSDGDNVDVVTP